MRRFRRLLLISLGFLVLLVALGTGGLFIYQSSLDSDIVRLPAALPTSKEEEKQRPQPKPGLGETWLLVGTDRRSEAATTGDDAKAELWQPGSQRTDTIMLAHLSEDRKHAAVVSIPRDSWVSIPGRGHAKINAAFSWGGPALLIRTIETLTGVRVDHYAAIDFKGFAAAVDAVDGVDVEVAKTVRDTNTGTTWTAGRHHLDGEQALLFVRQRYNLPGGDFGRIKRQQALLKALSDRVLSAGTLANPVKVDALLRAITKATTVDDGVSLETLRTRLVDLAGLDSSDYFTMPTKGTGMEGEQSVVYLDARKTRALSEAIKKDRAREYVERTGPGNAVDTVH
ncbi:LytR family transcriptional regulator [Nonomuraea phyllanthi]|uniref:LytR family transcriptional regulator n=1 Tax=Nonomuraea phyllanthi TaxID=2219224 RepID=A0A5C4WHW8_9ACTN|nr:LCP family protein [Nonomuraea phyllanthi]KAB8194021.1 LytR family transcriptional regulator [Nonomuraea phyllanthi]QFY07621.1 LytR family transcriptional regulator [Nonomuraea phyllanthi]